jgi:DNA repair protein RadD
MPSALLLDPELLAERAAILAVENDFPDEEAEALSWFWHSWAPSPPMPSRLTYTDWPLRPAWPQTVLQLCPYVSPVVLRPYQSDAVDAAYTAWQEGESVVLDLATGAGKSLVIAELCKRIPGRILVITHRAELLEQNSAELALLMGPSVDYGLYCAGLRKKQGGNRVVFASIASAYRSGDTLWKAGPFTAILIDEAHRVPLLHDAKGVPLASMYRSYFDAMPERPPLIGLTATPSRMGTPIYGHPDAWFARVASRASMRDLTPGYLLPLVPIQGIVTIDTSKVHTVGGEYNTRELSNAASEERIVEAAVEEICTHAPQVGCKSWLVFCVDQRHCHIVGAAFARRGVSVGVLTDQTPRKERAQLLAATKSGGLTCLVNCEIATTGSNIPRLDCLVILRPTKSKELFIQMLGRGTRQFEGLKRCIVMDYTDNSEQHAPLEGVPTLRGNPTLEAAREAEEEAAREAVRQREEERRAKHAATLAGKQDPSRARYQVESVQYSVSRTKDDTRDMLVVDYQCPARLRGKRLRIWVCLEHKGRALQAAKQWVMRRWESEEDAQHALGMSLVALAHHLRHRCLAPQTIVVDETDAFPRVLEEIWA